MKIGKYSKFQPIFLFVLFLLIAVAVSLKMISNGAFGGIGLDSSLLEWTTKIKGMDASTYLRVGLNFAEGRGLVDFCDSCQPPQDVAFYFWPPGTPLFFGIWQKLMPIQSVRFLFLVFWITYAIAGLILLKLCYEIFSSFWARSFSAVFISFFPPVLMYFFSPGGLSSSEVPCLIPLALLSLFLYRSFRSLRSNSDSIRNLWINFALVGGAIGLLANFRDSYSAFTYFIASVIVFGMFIKKYSMRKALISIGVLCFSAYLATVPVRIWNLNRLGAAILSSSGQVSIWRYGLWLNHFSHEFYKDTGIGGGFYLDPEAAKEVEEFYQKGGSGNLFSMKKFVIAVFNNPIKYAEFKLSRLPVLFLGSRDWPSHIITQFNFIWMSIFYFLLFSYLIWSSIKRIYVQEFLWLYLLFLSCAAGVIHFEFRYTIPIWLSLMLVPGMWIEQWSKKSKLSSS